MASRFWIWVNITNEAVLATDVYCTPDCCNLGALCSTPLFSIDSKTYLILDELALEYTLQRLLMSET